MLVLVLVLVVVVVVAVLVVVAVVVVMQLLLLLLLLFVVLIDMIVTLISVLLLLFAFWAAGPSRINSCCPTAPRAGASPEGTLVGTPLRSYIRITPRRQIAQSRSYVYTVGPRVGITSILGVLASYSYIL